MFFKSRLYLLLYKISIKFEKELDFLTAARTLIHTISGGVNLSILSHIYNLHVLRKRDFILVHVSIL